MSRPSAAPTDASCRGTEPRQAGSRYPPIGDYGFISDCHSTALISRSGSIDWCCMPRLDSASVFGRLLDWDRGGHCSIGVDHRPVETRRRYLDRTMVLETTMSTAEGALRIIDCMATTKGGAHHPRQQIIRVIEGLEGQVPVEIAVSIRFDYGSIRPWLRETSEGHFSAVGGSEGMVVWSDLPLQIRDRHDLIAEKVVEEGERRCLTLLFREPEEIDRGSPVTMDAGVVTDRLAETIEWWEAWCARREGDDDLHPDVLRSALVLKALVNAPTGAIAAAATTSLPEQIGGSRNWDYRFSWVRDSWLTVRSLADIGFHAEADGFRRFVERSAAGSVDELQLLYGVDGSHRQPELTLEELEGYRRSAPVRVGNRAARQLQLDTFGYLLELAWQWAGRGRSPEEPYWDFIVDVADRVCELWREPDHGIWEMRCEPRHFVHSKVLCWAALDRAVRLAETNLDGVDEHQERWAKARGEIRDAVAEQGVSDSRGCFVQRFGGGDDEMDAALLLLPAVGFVDYDDPRMIATVDAVIEDLDEDGLIRRYRTPDGLPGTEGAFLACTFWLVECLANLGRRDEAERYFASACVAGNDLGLLAEEYASATGEQLGNYPQALSHLAHIGAILSLGDSGPR